MPIIDLQLIFIGAVIDVIVDLVIFKLFRIREITTIITIIINFMIPYLSFWLLVQSGIPISQQVQALSDFIVFYMMNFVSFIISSVFGLFISAILCVFTGDKPPEF
jgi:hypothetical protein